MNASTRETFPLVVDFSHLRPGGENGGVKPLIFELMKWLGQQTDLPLTITYLTASCSHKDVRCLLRPGDQLVCVRLNSDEGVRVVGGWRDREFALPYPPIDLVRQLGGRLLYCPFGSTEFHTPGIPTISFVVDLLHRDYPETLTPRDVEFREETFREIVRVADRIQCNTQYVIDRMHAAYGVDRGNMFFTHNAIHSRLSRTISAIDATTTQRYFFYPANAWRHKNHEVLLVAFRQYLDLAGESAWRLVLTGHIDARMHEMQAIAKALGISEKVDFRGHVSEAELAVLWSNSSCLVFPSLHEGFGIPPIEAMHFEVPVICSDACSLPEVVADAAVLVNPRKPEDLAKALHRITFDHGLRKDLISRGRKRLEALTLDQEARKLLEAFHSASKGECRPLLRGIHVDGWTEGKVCFSIPKRSKLSTLIIRTNPMPCKRRIRVLKGSNFMGGFAIPEHTAHEVRVPMIADNPSIYLEIPDASNLAPQDARNHGVHMHSIEWECDGEQRILWRLGS